MAGIVATGKCKGHNFNFATPPREMAPRVSIDKIKIHYPHNFIIPASQATYDTELSSPHQLHVANHSLLATKIELSANSNHITYHIVYMTLK